ncbi:MAG: TonB-dependent receptor [Caulobacteraceae bacterium]
MFLAICAALISGQQARAAEPELTHLSLEDLLSTEVTSVAKKPQRVDEASAAIFVIGQDDIRRSGKTTIPDLLRLAPGLEVASLPHGGAAVTARGFNGLSANKLLVLVDGRAIYLSAFSGVFWDQQMLPVEDIQRIEVVRGPGATLWGANAVNGVINIVSKHSVDTLGAFGSGQVDSAGGRRFNARYGVQLGGSGALRVYMNGSRNDALAQVGPLEVNDHSRGLQGGFRMDLEPSERDAVTLQGDLQDGEHHFPDAFSLSPAALPLPTASRSKGANILGRWTRTWSDRAGMSLQAYWDHVHREESALDGRSDQFDVDFSHHFDLNAHNAVVWGLGYRRAIDDVKGAPYIYMNPQRGQNDWYGAYVEDDIRLAGDRLTLSLGGKFEHNDFSGFEFQPSVRALWRSPWGWSVWGAVSRAVRTPSRFESTLTVLSPVLELLPARLDSEKVTSYELGWRGEVVHGVALDLAAYRSNYTGLITDAVTGAAGPFGPYITQLGNRTTGHGTGVEAALDLKLSPTWTVKASASWQDLDVAPVAGTTNIAGLSIDEGLSPRTQLSLRSQWNVSDAVDLDVWYRHVDRLRTGPVNAYDSLDLHVAWRPTAHLELSVVGSNLLAAKTVEIALPTNPFQAVAQRRVQVGLTARY